MTISISITGHTPDKESENGMLRIARDAVREMADKGEVYGASASTTHHGVVDLRDAPEVVGSSDSDEG